MVVSSRVERLDALTGVRFVAAAMIVVHHSRMFNIPVPPILLDHAVSIFFVLSGFILTWVHPQLHSSHERYVFVWDRLSRIWPAHVVTLIATVLLRKLPITWAFPLNFLLLHGWLPAGVSYFSYNAVSWSVSTELAFYLTFPFWIRNWYATFWWKIPLSFGIVAATIFACDLLRMGGFGYDTTFTAHGLIYIGPLGRIFEFVVGIACCSIFRWMLARGSVGIALSTGLEVAAIIVLFHSLSARTMGMFAGSVSEGWMTWLSHSSSVLGAALTILALAAGRGPFAALLCHPALVRLGDISFAIYMTHQIVGTAYLMHVPSTGSADWSAFAICTGITLVASYALWRFVENPARSAMRRLVQQPTQPKVAPAE
jgi:peptidoglycan/LPS O-acetylase OafA/YrhL